VSNTGDKKYHARNANNISKKVKGSVEGRKRDMVVSTIKITANESI